MGVPLTYDLPEQEANRIARRMDGMQGAACKSLPCISCFLLRCVWLEAHSPELRALNH